jgi:uncharacterized protein YndB with AHSA1/START domain
LVVTSEFAAPRDLLFQTHTDPELMVQWLGPYGLPLTVDHVDPRHGGTWCYIGSDADGSKYSFRGVFHDTPSPYGIVRTVEFDGMPGHVGLETVTFTERGDTTLVTHKTIYQSVQGRDRVLRYDMAEDINESIDRLEELLARLVPVS